MNFSPLVSFVITTKNEEKNISNLLDSISSQSYKNYEIIIVDNFSDDQTKNISLRYDKVKFFEAGPERGHQRTFGVNKAKGEYIFWPDADHILTQNLVQDCINIFEITKNICIFIPERIIENNFFNKIRNFERSFYDGTPIDCPRVIPKNIFLKVIEEQRKSITFNAGPDDWDIYNYCEIFSSFTTVDSIMHHNESNLSFKNYLKKKIKYMPDMDGFKKKWKNHHLHKFRFGIYYRLIGVFFTPKNRKILIKRIHLFFPMIILRAIVAFIYLVKA